MGESSGASGAGEIGRLRQEILALADADRVRPEDEGTLLSALDAALQELTGGDRSEATPGATAQAAIERFIAGAQALIAAGVLSAGEGEPPLAAARALLAAWRG